MKTQPFLNMRYIKASLLVSVLIGIANLVNDPDMDIEPLGTHNVAWPLAEIVDVLTKLYHLVLFLSVLESATDKKVIRIYFVSACEHSFKAPQNCISHFQQGTDKQMTCGFMAFPTVQPWKADN